MAPGVAPSDLLDRWRISQHPALAALRAPVTPDYRWWASEWPLTHRLEEHAARVDPSIERLPLPLVHQNPVLRRYIAGFRVPAAYVWGYLAPAEGPWPERRLIAVFKGHPAKEEPVMLCLDGPTDSEHRYPDAERRRLCLYYPKDPAERRWHVHDGLVRLFDLGRQHVLAEHIARERGGRPEDWPIEFAAHGPATPAPSHPAIALPAELPELAPRVGAPLR